MTPKSLSIEPFREEFGVCQRVSVSRGRELPFPGIDSNDARGHALAFVAPFLSVSRLDQAVRRCTMDA
jgi:hypothetical protein